MAMAASMSTARGIPTVTTAGGWVWANGGEVLSADLKRCLMNTPQAIGGLKFYIDLSLVHHVAPTPAQSMGQDLDDLFGKGSAR
jgi:ABC-type glycerol-3-phosphate transport system substrate-binding protein